MGAGFWAVWGMGMKEIRIAAENAGQRLDKFLQKTLNTAPRGLIYKLLRKKRIKINGKRAGGNEILCPGDVLTLYLAEDTLAGLAECRAVPQAPQQFTVVYEDEGLLAVNKPAGVLSQPERAEERQSLIDQIRYYLYRTGAYDPAGDFAPALCNRLDRNTSGLVLAGKTYAALREANTALAERRLHKYYAALAVGRVEAGRLAGYYRKDGAANRAEILAEPAPGAQPVAVALSPRQEFVREGRPFTLVEVELLTGKSHQIRAQLAAAGHPLVGDPKYGDKTIHQWFAARAGLRRQFLHAARLVWPERGWELLAPLPPELERVMVWIKEES